MQLLRRDDGAVAVMVIILAVVLFGVGALVVDLGVAFEKRRELQKDADLAALAGGQVLVQSQADAQKVAADYLRYNGWSTLQDGDLADGSDANGEAKTTATSLEVIAPTVHVDFGLGRIFLLLDDQAPTSTEVSARAMVQLESPAYGILPFYLPSDISAGIGCIKTNPNADDCGEPNEGNFGLADSPRSDGNDHQLEKNIAKGLDHTPAIFPDPPHDTRCIADGSPAGAIMDDKGKNGFNCLMTEDGDKAGPVTSGLLTLTGKDCDGRLAVSGSTDLKLGGCNVAKDKFASYLPGGHVPGDLLTLPTASIDASIMSDPRFGVIPVIAPTSADDLTGKKPWPIVTFYGAYIKALYNNKGKLATGNNQISALTAYLFPMDRLPATLPNTGGSVPYLGVGPAIPVLVE